MSFAAKMTNINLLQRVKYKLEEHRSNCDTKDFFILGDSLDLPYNFRLLTLFYANEAINRANGRAYLVCIINRSS